MGAEAAQGGAALRPGSLAEARDAMIATAGAGQRVLIRGAGTAQGWGAPVTADAVIDTTGLDGFLTYNPADMTVAVGAGMPLRDLQARLDGQQIMLDAARIGSGATVGGLLATADGGPRRAAYGTLRDLVIGATVVLADGSVARSGGHVIKNVAGYDLVKVLSGSLGTLALVAEVVLRVHPAPEASRTLTVRCDPATALDTARALLGSPLEPLALDWHGDRLGDRLGGRLLVRFEGTAAGVAGRAEKAAGLADGPCDVLDGAAEDEVWRALADTVLGAEDDTVLRAGTRADRFPVLAERLDTLAGEQGVDAALTSGLGIGVHTVRLSGGTPRAHAAVLESWRATALDGGGSVTVHRRPPGAGDPPGEGPAAWGPPPASIGALRALKRSLDPDDRLGPGRFAPWW